jgi:hypothetical protein
MLDRMHRTSYRTTHGPSIRAAATSSGDPVAWMLDHAPLDDEPKTEEERKAVAEAHADRERA